MRERALGLQPEELVELRVMVQAGLVEDLPVDLDAGERAPVALDAAEDTGALEVMIGSRVFEVHRPHGAGWPREALDHPREPRHHELGVHPVDANRGAGKAQPEGGRVVLLDQGEARSRPRTSAGTAGRARCRHAAWERAR